jgi:uncharacterized protein (DUF885 family)
MAWLDEFFGAYYAARPVNATFIGVHAHDGDLPDFSHNGAGDVVATMQDLLRRAPAASIRADGDGGQADSLSGGIDAETIDHRLATGFLRTQVREYESAHFHRGNPSTHTGEAVFSLLSLFLSEYAPFAHRLDAALRRLDEMPAFLRTGQNVLQASPAAWTERAIRECSGARAFLVDGLPLLLEEACTSGRIPSSVRDTALRLAARANEAFAGFAHWLGHTHRKRSETDIACGEEMLRLYLREAHFVDEDPEDIVAYAEEELRSAMAWLSAHASDHGCDTPADVIASLAGLHPDVEDYYGRYADVLQAIRSIAKDGDLLTWPDFPIRFVPRPIWVRSAAPSLYFLFYRSPAAFHRPPVHEYVVTPVEPDMSADEQERLLRATNDSVIRLNHVIHHGGIGHHVQNWHAFRSGSRVGRIAAVDCASRIAMMCGGTMAEGWACYATDLMAEAGALSPLERYAEVHSRVRMCARAIVDIRLHTGRMTLDDAAGFYTREAGMKASAAFAEAVKNSMFPAGAVMYLLGRDGIMRLRERLSIAMGSAFDLRRFHDTLLSFGSIPVSLVEKAMTASFPRTDAPPRGGRA